MLASACILNPASCMHLLHAAWRMMMCARRPALYYAPYNMLYPIIYIYCMSCLSIYYICIDAAPAALPPARTRTTIRKGEPPDRQEKFCALRSQATTVSATASSSDHLGPPRRSAGSSTRQGHQKRRGDQAASWHQQSNLPVYRRGGPVDLHRWALDIDNHRRQT